MQGSSSSSRRRRTSPRRQGVTAAEATNLTDADASAGRNLSIGLGVTHSGSMIKELFVEWCYVRRGAGRGARSAHPTESHPVRRDDEKGRRATAAAAAAAAGAAPAVTVTVRCIINNNQWDGQLYAMGSPADDKSPGSATDTSMFYLAPAPALARQGKHLGFYLPRLRTQRL